MKILWEIGFKSMTNINLEQSLKELLEKQKSIEELRMLLVEFKNQGGSQLDALDIIQNVRLNNSSDKVDDCLLELMDFASGYCRIELRVW